jgi:hypothetical protein
MMKKNEAIVKEIELADILNKLPDTIPLNCNKEFSETEYDIFFCALGFEERCLTIPEQLADTKHFKCKQAVYFEYSTNVEDNEVNKPRLIRAFQEFANPRDPLPCNVEDFTKNLRAFLNQTATSQENPKIIFDISVCSSKLLISTMKVLFEFNIYLQIVYSEAETYHPTLEEFEKDSEKWTSEENFGIARGVGKVIPSPEYPGTRRENPDIIIAFPTFKPERTKAIITYIDESILIRPEKRIVWIVGDPHMDEETKSKRKDIIRKINEISEEALSYEVSTLNYKKTLEVLEQIYKNKNFDSHINISALGSKMQSLGIAFFCYIRPDVPVYLAIPKEFNPRQYSEGCKGIWIIDFENLSEIRGMLNRVGMIEMRNREYIEEF